MDEVAVTCARVAVIFPDADTTQVEQFRAQWDPLASVVAAHITIAYPFSWTHPINELEAVLADVASETPAFPVRLTDAIGWEDEYVFLQAQIGAAEISRLHHRLYQQPALGLAAPHSFVPHMTVGRRQRPDDLRSSVAQANASALTVAGRALALTVYRIAPDGQRINELSIPFTRSSR
jgi:2'-5' RNA ligase